jgi:plastocyanin domain-containing protein
MKGTAMKTLVLVLLLTACARHEQPVAQRSTTPSPATSVQEHTIDVAAGFTPASVTLKAGQPARLHFHRGDAATCADEIVLPELNLRKKLDANQTVTFDLPAQKARTLNFACGMGMMKGTAVVQ